MSIVGDLVGSFLGANSAENATDAQERAANNATAAQERMYNQTREDNLPALLARNQAVNQLANFLGVSGNKSAPGYGSWVNELTPTDVQNEPGYQFGLQQGMNALNNRLAAGGNYYSGAAIKQSQRYAQDYAGTKYNDAFNRLASQRQNQYNMYAGLGGLGQVGANTVASAGQNFANQAGANIIGAGDARAAGSIATGNALTNGINGALYHARNYLNQNPFSGVGGGSDSWGSLGISPGSNMSGWNSPSNNEIWNQMMGG